jgi:hypothetical protein
MRAKNRGPGTRTGRPGLQWQSSERGSPCAFCMLLPQCCDGAPTDAGRRPRCQPGPAPSASMPPTWQSEACGRARQSSSPPTVGRPSRDHRCRGAGGRLTQAARRTARCSRQRATPCRLAMVHRCQNASIGLPPCRPGGGRHALGSDQVPKGTGVHQATRAPQRLVEPEQGRIGYSCLWRRRPRRGQILRFITRH